MGTTLEGFFAVGLSLPWRKARRLCSGTILPALLEKVKLPAAIKFRCGGCHALRVIGTFRLSRQAMLPYVKIAVGKRPLVGGGNSPKPS